LARLKQTYQSNHFFGIGIMNNVHEANIGTLWRSAYVMGASFIFTVDKKYKQQSGDVIVAWSKIPLYHYPTIHELKANLPYATRLIGVEMTEKAVPIGEYTHPSMGVYLLGSEKDGLSTEVLNACHELVSLPGHFSLNVAVAGSILMYDRISKLKTVLPQ
jgi:tRNA G18 (ribose-2'-O)-methylase SpoU